MSIRLILVSVVLLGGVHVVLGQTSAQFQIPITVTNGIHTQVLTIGVSGDGDGGTIQDNTIGVDFDPSFGPYQELVAPPVPPQPYDFDARVLTIPGRTPTFPAGLGGGVYKDFRGFSDPVQVDSFRINFTGDAIDTAPTTISWPSTITQYGTAWVIRPLSGSEWTPVNMLIASSVTVPAGVLQKNALIIKTGVAPPAPVSLTFLADMKVKMLERTFRPDLGDYVTVRGSFNDWGNSTGNVDTLKDLNQDSIYTLTRPVPGSTQISYRFWKTPRGQGGYETLSADRLFSVPSTADTVPVARFGNDSLLSVVATYGTGWDMISNPVAAPVDSVRALFPASDLSYAFAFLPGAGYQQSATMETGRGYWAKFSAPGSSDIAGALVLADTVPVAAGWNMIGSISVPVDTAEIIGVPPGIIGSVYFGYAPGYVADAAVRPGRAYWVKARAAGEIILRTSALNTVQAGSVTVRSRLTSLTITDTRGRGQTLFLSGDVIPPERFERLSMPPVPPAGELNARFASGGLEESVSPDAARPVRLIVETPAWPVTIRWEAPDDAPLMELQAGAAAHVLKGSGALRVPGPAEIEIAARSTGGDVPLEFALNQNHPNPFNPSTSIGYTLPVASQVSLRVFDVLGREIALLVDDVQSAGKHAAEWNGKGRGGEQVASGVYLCRLDASPVTGGRSRSSIRKMMLLK